MTKSMCSFKSKFPTIVGYPSVSLSLTLDKNEKVKYYIRKNIHKPIVLRWLKVV